MRFATYKKVASITEALKHISDAEQKPLVINGGTDVMIELHGSTSEESYSCIDISDVEELKGITEGKEITIGAGTLLTDIAESEVITGSSLVLAEAASQVGSPQIRNRASIGGNVITAAQCADTIPVLLTLDAQLKLVSASGEERMISIGDFFTGPKQTDIRGDELLTKISYESLEGKGYTGRFFKLIRREAVAKSRLNYSVLMKQADDGNIEDIRISIGSALSVPGRFFGVEDFLKGRPATNGLFKEAAQRCADYVLEVTGNRWSTPYKQPVIRDVIYRMLCQCSGIKE